MTGARRALVPALGASQVLAAVGALAAAAALRGSGTPAGALAWVLATAIACIGVGDALARWLGERPTIGDAAATGLACLLVGSTLIAHAGILTREVQIGAIGGGIVLCALGRRGRALPGRGMNPDPSLFGPGAPATTPPPATLPRRLFVLVALAGALLVASQLTGVSSWATDGVNHTMEVKRLWDTRALGDLPHQAGGLIVAESYLALIGGPGTAGAFDSGLCAALVVLLLACELAPRRGLALPICLILVIPIVLNPEPTVTPVARWSGTLFHLACWFGLERALGERRRTGWVVPSALALIAIRWEFVVIALPYVAAGALLTREARPSRRAIAITAAVWLAALTLLAPGATGTLRAIGLTATAAAITALALPLIGTYPWRSAIGVLVFVIAAASLTGVFGVVPPSIHSGSQVSTLWFTAGVAVFAHSGELAPGNDRPRIRLLVLVLALAGLLALSVLWPNFVDQRHDRLRDRFLAAIDDLQFVAASGYDAHQAEAAARLQRRVPPGATIGLWGAAAGTLDYARNPITDVSWQGGRNLAPLTRAQLRRITYLVVEGLAPTPSDPVPRSRDPWGRGQRSATGAVDAWLVPVDVAGTTRLYRVELDPPVSSGTR